MSYLRHLRCLAKECTLIDYRFAKRCYKNGRIVILTLHDGQVLMPHTYRAFKKVYKICKSGNLISKISSQLIENLM